MYDESLQDIINAADHGVQELEAEGRLLAMGDEQDLDLAMRACDGARTDVSDAVSCERRAASIPPDPPDESGKIPTMGANQQERERLLNLARQYRDDATHKLNVTREALDGFSSRARAVGERAVELSSMIGSKLEGAGQPEAHLAVASGHQAAEKAGEAAMLARRAHDELPASGDDATDDNLRESASVVDGARYSVQESLSAMRHTAALAIGYTSMQRSSIIDLGRGGGGMGYGQPYMIPGYGEAPVPLENRFTGNDTTGEDQTAGQEKDFGYINQDGQYVKSDMPRNPDGSYVGGTETLDQHVEKFPATFYLSASEDDRTPGQREVDD